MHENYFISLFPLFVLRVFVFRGSECVGNASAVRVKVTHFQFVCGEITLHSIRVFPPTMPFFLFFFFSIRLKTAHTSVRLRAHTHKHIGLLLVSRPPHLRDCTHKIHTYFSTFSRSAIHTLEIRSKAIFHLKICLSDAKIL